MTTLRSSGNGPLRPFSPTGTAQLQAWQQGLLPPVESLGAGLWSIPVPLPLDGLRYVLVYALETASGVALVDAGWETEQAWTHLRAGLDHIGAALSDVEAVIVTHLHPDHYGLAGRVREASGAWIGLHPADADLISGHQEGAASGPLSGIRRVLTLAGVPNSEMGFLDVASGLAEGLVKVRPDRLIQDGERLPLAGWNLRAVHTPGHSPGHLCFYEADRRVLLTGDHLLPRITPNIGVAALTGEGTLAEFMASLDRIVDLDGHVDEVMPAHEYRFAGAGARAQILKQHHDRRLAHLHGLLSVPMTAWEVAERVEWSRPWSDVPPLMRPAAVAEVLAHLVLLEQRGAVHRASGRATDSAWIWARTQTTH